MIYRGIIKSGNVFKIRVFHSKLCGTLVHSRYEDRLAARNKLRKSYGCIVCACYHNALDKLLDGHLFPFL